MPALMGLCLEKQARKDIFLKLRHHRDRGSIDILKVNMYIMSRFFDSKAPHKEGAMYAIVDIAGKQYKVNTEETITVPSLEKKPGDKVTFDKVLLVGDDNSTRIGTPHVAGSVVEGTVVDHQPADKVIVFKKKKRKGYRVKRGHRQEYTQVRITSIGS